MLGDKLSDLIADLTVRHTEFREAIRQAERSGHYKADHLMAAVVANAKLEGVIKEMEWTLQALDADKPPAKEG